MRWQTIVAGALGLALLEVTVSSTAAAGRVGDLMTAVAGVIRHVLSPAVAAIPDRRQHGGAAVASSATQGAPSVQPATASGSLLPPDWTTSPTVSPA